MYPPEGPDSAGVRRKDSYHHGDLREALISAARQLIIERGAENFSLADACRLAGVSTAAPYRHFRDRDELVMEVCSRGFDELAMQTMRAVEKKGPGTIEGIIAMGQAYVAFAVSETALFRLMFGQDPAIKKLEPVSDTGRACFAQVIEQVALFCARNGQEADARELAVRLWTFVHGAASLVIDSDYEKVAPKLDVDLMISRAAPLLLRP